MLTTLCLTLFFALHCAAALMRNTLWMRLCSFAGSFVGMIGAWWRAPALFSPPPAFTPDQSLWRIVAWGCTALWIAHGFMLARLLNQRTSLRWTPEELELRTTVFAQMDSRTFRKLMALARWRTLKPTSVLVSEGKDVQHVALIVSGAAIVQVRGQIVAYLTHGRFIGEMTLLGGGKASATVRITEPTRCVAWDVAALRRLMKNDPVLEAVLTDIFSADLQGKIVTTQANHASHTNEYAERQENALNDPEHDPEHDEERDETE
jgi:CRP-like cAMP-binding protein